jgi:site-specific recombinase XerC
LRAGEIVSLELDDVCWRTAEIVVGGKGRTIKRLPLLQDIAKPWPSTFGRIVASANHDESSCECGRRVSV